MAREDFEDDYESDNADKDVTPVRIRKLYCHSIGCREAISIERAES